MLMDVELRDLKWAIAASQHRSLRRAAEVLNIRQSTLSRRIQDLERRLGVKLFERTNGGTRPTLMGREFLDISQHVIEETVAAFTRFKAMSNGQEGRLSIGIYVSLATGNLRATLVEYHRRFPNVDIHTVDGTHERLFSNMISSTVDVAIMTTYSPAWDDHKLPLWSERVIAALPERHRLAENPCFIGPTSQASPSWCRNVARDRRCRDYSPSNLILSACSGF